MSPKTATTTGSKTKVTKRKNAEAKVEATTTVENVNESDMPLPPPAPRAFQDLILSELWMRPWAEIAVATSSMSDACAKVGVSIADFAAARGRDSVFDSLCRVTEELVDLRIMDTLCCGAIRGEARFLALYFGRGRDLLFDTGVKPADTTISASVAEAMIRAGLAVESTSPALKSSRPKTKPARNSYEDFDEE